jgi:ERCC4-type nuclease
MNINLNYFGILYKINKTNNIMSDSFEDNLLNVTIDNRESKIITELDNSPPFLYKKTNMEIGDFKFEMCNKKILIERKTVDDLIASIKDGRYKEQKCRLINEQRNNTTVIYLIEGDIWKSKKFKPDTLYSALINTMIRDNIFVYISKDIHHTILFLTKIYKQLEKTKDVPPTATGEDTSYAQYIKPNKKANITPKICFINQLRQIPMVSYTIATVIADKYGTMKNLLTTATPEELYEIKINNRRISKAIVDFIM